jgi:putative MFS transporter
VAAPAQPTIQSYLDRFDRARLGGFHLRLLFIAGLSWMWAALGVSIVGYILPVLRTEWGLSSGQEGLVASFGLLGMMIGAIGAGSLADRIGRRATMALIMLWLGVFSALASFSPSYPVLLGLRLLTGLGLGAVLPVASTLVSEYSPTRYRGGLLVVLNAFWGLGGGLAALTGYIFVAQYGWRPALLFTSISIVSAPLVWWLLPESMRFLAGHGRTAEALAIARRIAVTPDERAPQAAPTTAPGQTSQPPQPGNTGLFSRAYLGRTASLWLVWFALNFTFQGVYVWLPTLLISGGSTMAQSYLLSLVISLGQVPGNLLAALLADRTSRRLSMGVTMVLWGLAVILFGFSASPAGVLLWGFLLSMGNGAAWGLAYPFTTELYPTRMRGAATGWATGFGRIGGIVAPLVVGALIAARAGNPLIFSLLGAAPALATLSLAGLRQSTTGKTLEEISQE